MSLADKLTLIHDGREDPRAYQGQAGYVAGIPRLGIPGLRLADGPPGVLTRHPSQAETATMGVAATFDVHLAQENGAVIGREARALGIDVSLQPLINIDRDLAFKRAYDTAATDVWLDEQALHEIYLAPFEAAIDAGVAAVMCSYNHVNGPYACGNSSLLTRVLRDELQHSRGGRGAGRGRERCRCQGRARNSGRGTPGGFRDRG